MPSSFYRGRKPLGKYINLNEQIEQDYDAYNDEQKAEENMRTKSNKDLDMLGDQQRYQSDFVYDTYEIPRRQETQTYEQ